MTLIKRYFIWLAVAMGGLALVAVPVYAIIGGTQDTTNMFPSTGLVVANGHHECSGSLYRTSTAQKSSTTFMTAAHCIVGVDLTNAAVTFDPAGDTNPNAAYIPVVAAYAIPGYSAANNNSLQNGNGGSDVGVLILKTAPKGIMPVDLPSIGLVDTLDFNSQMIMTVGYGINDFSNGSLTAGSFSIGPRFYRNTSITPGQRTQTAASYLKAEASTCYGDSGGPNFLTGTNTVVGDTVWGQSKVCSDHNYIFRIDNADALNFLNNPASIGVSN